MSTLITASEPTSRMRKLEERCRLFFGSNIKGANALWTPAGECDIAVELQKWDGSKRVVPERELERVFAQ